MLNETKITNSYNLKMSNFNCYRKERNNNYGGVALLIRNNIPHIKINITNNKLEMIAIRLASGVVLVSIYIKPAFK